MFATGNKPLLSLLCYPHIVLLLICESVKIYVSVLLLMGNIIVSNLLVVTVRTAINLHAHVFR